MLDQVWLENRQRLRTVIRNIVPDPSTVDDLLQEAFLKALRTDRKFETPRDALSFLCRVAINTTIDHYRRNRRQQQFRTAEEQDCYLESGTESRPQQDPLHILLRQERHDFQEDMLREIGRAMKKLPKAQRDAVRLVFGKRSRSLKEICSARGIAYSTVRSRMLRGIDAIREHLQKRGVYSNEE